MAWLWCKRRHEARRGQGNAGDDIYFSAHYRLHVKWCWSQIFKLYCLNNNWICFRPKARSLSVKKKPRLLKRFYVYVLLLFIFSVNIIMHFCYFYAWLNFKIFYKFISLLFGTWWLQRGIISSLASLRLADNRCCPKWRCPHSKTVLALFHLLSSMILLRYIEWLSVYDDTVWRKKRAPSSLALVRC